MAVLRDERDAFFRIEKFNVFINYAADIAAAVFCVGDYQHKPCGYGSYLP